MLTLIVALGLVITSVPAIALSRSWWVAGCYAVLATLCWPSPEVALSAGVGLATAYGLVWAATRTP